MKLVTYLHFDGRCREAFQFYAQCLGGRIEAMLTHGETPMAAHVPVGWHDKIGHARLVLGDQVLMGGDSPPAYQRPMQGFSVHLAVDDGAEAQRIFGAFGEGGHVVMPMEETFWASHFGMVVDRFGTPWMVSHEKPPA